MIVAEEKKKLDRRRVIVVVGMHRSGTSAIARGLQVLGIDLGNNLMPAAADNEKGFWEDLEFAELNIELLEYLGHDWHTLYPMTAEELESEILDGFRAQAVALIRRKLKQAMFFGLKDPRVTRLLPFWDAIFRREGLDPSYILVVRNPVSVIESLRKRDGFTLTKSTYLWLQHVIPSMASLRSKQALVIEFERLMIDPDKQLRRISACLDLPAPDSTRLAEYKSEFLDTSLQHERYEDLSAIPCAVELVKDAYALLTKFARDELDLHAKGVERRLRRLNIGLEGLSPMLHLEARRESQALIADYSRQVDEIESRLSSTKDISANLEKEIEEAKINSGNLNKELEKARTNFENLHEEFDEKSEWANSLNSDLEKTHRQLDYQVRWGKKLDDQLEERSQWARRLDADLRDSQTKFESLQKEFTERSEWAHSLQKDLEKAQLVLDSQRQETQHALRWGKKLDEQLEERSQWAHLLQDDLEKTRLLLDSQRRETQDANVQLEQRSQWAHRLDIDLRDSHSKFESLQQEFTERSEWAIALNAELEEKNDLLEAANQQISQQHEFIQQKEEQIRQVANSYLNQLNDIRDSTSWKLTKPLRGVKRLGQRISTGSKVGAYKLLTKIPLTPRFSSRLQTLVYTHTKLLRSTQAYGMWKSRWDYLLDCEDWVLPKPAKSPQVSIIIPVYGQLGYTLQCLRSIFTSSHSSKYEIIVVDDCSPDDSYETLLKLSGIRLYRNKTNLRFIRTCNFGAKAANGKILIFLNNDTEILPEWLDAIVWAFDNIKDAGVVGSKLIYPDGRLQEAGGILWKDGTAWNFGRSKDPQSSEFNYLREVDYCSGASFAIPRQLFMDLGGFDEEYLPAYCEDSDLCMKVRESGLKVYYQPFSQVIHHEGISHGTSLAEGIKSHQVENQHKLLARWKSTFEHENLNNAENVFLARDRSQGKQLILVIDHYIPQPDKDAGSKTMVHFMSTLQDLGFVVKFWPDNLHYDPDYTRLLQERGIETFYGEEYYNGFDSWCINNLRYFDYILVSRPNVAATKIDSILASKRIDSRVLYYGHDIYHQRLERQFEIRRDPECLKQAAIFKVQEINAWGKADLILYPSQEEAEYVNSIDGKYKARSIQPYFIEEFPSKSQLTPKHRDGILFVAGFGHPPNEDAAVWLVKAIMPIVWNTLPEVKVSLVGSNPTDKVRSLASNKVDVTGYVTEDQLRKYYREYKVAIVPLTYGAGIKSKVVEAICYGIPLVTTTTGAQGLPGLDQYSAVSDDENDIADAVLRFYQDKESWLESSHKSVQYAAEIFSKSSMSSQWQQIFQDLSAANEYRHAS